MSGHNPTKSARRGRQCNFISRNLGHKERISIKASITVQFFSWQFCWKSIEILQKFIMGVTNIYFFASKDKEEGMRERGDALNKRIIVKISKLTDWDVYLLLSNRWAHFETITDEICIRLGRGMRHKKMNFPMVKTIQPHLVAK